MFYFLNASAIRLLNSTKSLIFQVLKIHLSTLCCFTKQCYIKHSTQDKKKTSWTEQGHTRVPSISFYFDLSKTSSKLCGTTCKMVLARIQFRLNFNLITITFQTPSRLIPDTFQTPYRNSPDLPNTFQEPSATFPYH